MSPPDTLQFEEIRHGSAEYDTLVELRDEILRRPLGRTFTSEQLAAERQDRHLACYQNAVLVGCLLLADRGGGTVQMRQVAVRADQQGKGVGRALVEHAEMVAAHAGFQTMMLHARDTAAGFYERLGYRRVGAEFLEVGLPHWEMEKRLDGVGD